MCLHNLLAVVSKPVPDADFIGATEDDDAQANRQKVSDGLMDFPDNGW